MLSYESSMKIDTYCSCRIGLQKKVDNCICNPSGFWINTKRYLGRTHKRNRGHDDERWGWRKWRAEPGIGSESLLKGWRASIRSRKSQKGHRARDWTFKVRTWFYIFNNRLFIFFFFFEGLSCLRKTGCWKFWGPDWTIITMLKWARVRV